MTKSIWKQKPRWNFGKRPEAETAAGSELPSLINKGVGLVTGLGKRLLIHFAGLITGAILQSTISLPVSAPFMAPGSIIICCYLGVICLLPPSMGKREDWYIPSVAGLALALVWPLFGVPWQFTLLWGGLCTWLIRFAARKGQMGWEWSAVPWLLVALYLFMSDLRPLYHASTPYWSLPLFVLGGWAGVRLYGKVRFNSIHRNILEDGAAIMNALAQAGTLPPVLEAPVRRLGKQGSRFFELAPGFDKQSAAMVLEYADAAAWLQERAKLPAVVLAAQSGQQVAEELENLSRQFAQRISPLEPIQQSTDPQALRMAEFAKSADALVDKARALPGELQGHIRGIRSATDDILTCMREDPSDVLPGDKFLSRYLKAAHSVVDEYVRLAPQSSAHEHIANALERSRDVLARLEQAFEHEHAQLLQNDTMNLTAELNVLDKLLKMDGK